MNPIIEEIKEELPADAGITDISYEGSEIILYTNNKRFFTSSTDLIKQIVSKIKKRIEVRADPSIIIDQEKTKELIKDIVPQEASIKDIYFEPEFARVVIHAEKPGLVIGKNGETLISIKENTFWTPHINRAPAIDSEIIRSIRKMLHKEAGYRKKFLNKMGEKIYSEGKEVEWIRVTALGAFREVGRSCVLLQTPESKVLFDCGMSVAATASKPFPYLDAPEFHIQELDAVILSHAHLDHCLPPQTSVVMADGSIKPIKEVEEGDSVLSVNFETGKMEAGICNGKTSTKGHKTIRQIKTSFRIIEASPNHRFFVVDDLKIKEIEAQDIKKGELLPVALTKDEKNKHEVTLNTHVKYDKRRKNTVVLPSILDEKLASLIGYMQGDGHKSSDFSIRVTDSDISLLEFYRNLVKGIFNFSAAIRHHSDKKKNAWVLEINNIKIMRFLEANFPNFLYKTLKRTIPEKIMTADSPIKAAYIRGLMDADGAVITKVPSIKFTSYSPDLLEGVGSTMKNMGLPCTLDKNYKTIKISSLSGIRAFVEKIGFNSLQKKNKTLIISKTSIYEKNLVPIKSRDLKKIVKDARIFGTVHNSPNFRKKTGLYDWLRRPEESHCTRRTAFNLVEMLEQRANELQGMTEQLEQNNLKHVRQSLSIPLSSLSEETGIERHVLQHRELGYVDHIHQIFCNVLREKLIASIEATRSNINKIRKILALPVSWELVTDIATIENPYEELIDIEVLPNRNFIASGTIVHNSGLVPYLYEYGYRGPLYCTRPTRDLSALLQLDYLQICQRENKKAFYTSKGIEEAIKHCVSLDYGEVSDIAPDMRLTLENAGHMLGSSLCHVHIGDGLYNVLYSLDWTSPVVFINPYGELAIEPIGKVVDELLKNGNTASDGFVERVGNEAGWKAIAFNPKTLKAETVPITSFMRHPITEKLYRIRAEGGKEAIVTASHNVFQVIDGEIRAVKTKDLRHGQFILGARYLPVEEKEPVVDLTPYSSELRLQFDEKEIRTKVLELLDRARTFYPKSYKDVLTYVIEYYSGKLLHEIAQKYKRKASTIRKYLAEMGIRPHPRRGHTMPSKLHITPDFARFLGYFVSEGALRENGVQITNYEKNVLEDCFNICRTELGIEGKIYKNVVIFDSRQLKFLLESVLGCGDSAYSKRVPKAILQAPSGVVWEFLRGYYIGDGNFRVRPSGCCISANSKNPELIRDIAAMLSRFGIVPSLEFNRSSIMYMAHVNVLEQIEKMLSEMNIPKWTAKLATKLRQRMRAGINERVPINALTGSVQAQISRTSYQNAITAGMLTLQKMASLQDTDKRLMSSCFAFAKILSIEEVEPTSPYVYDLCIEGYENFLTGQGLLFVHNTGDIKYEKTKLFEKSSTDFTRAETVIIEGTYGANDDVMPQHRDGEKMLVDFVKKAIARGGRVLIPSFAVGRSQDAITILADTDIDVPIYLDGMLWDATAIHTAYPEFMAQNVQNQILHKGNNPFIDPRLKGIGSQKERIEVFDSKEPCIVVSTSGMLMGGPAIEYLKNFAGDAKNMLLFVGYQAEGSPGRRIQKGWKQIQLEDGTMLELNLEIATVRGLSGHSDQRQLIDFIQHLNNKPRKILVNHCENSKCVELARTIHKMFRIESVAPKNLETIRLR